MQNLSGSISASPIYDNRRVSTGQLLLVRDVTEQKRTEAKLQLMAITDPLTGLFNRRHFFAIAEREHERYLRTHQPFAILLFDVDHFKNVNDTYGHLAGDQVLQKLAERCHEILRPYDVMARYGGEEFIVLFPGMGQAQTQQVGERLRSKIADTPIETNAGYAWVTISLGAAILEKEIDLRRRVPFKPGAGPGAAGRRCAPESGCLGAGGTWPQRGVGAMFARNRAVFLRLQSHQARSATGLQWKFQRRCGRWTANPGIFPQNPGNFNGGC